MREKLIELLGADTCTENNCCDDCVYHENEEACVQYLKVKMADHLIANGVTIQKWIPVTERVPENNTRNVVCYIDPIDGEKTVSSDVFWKEHWVRFGEYVTHWKPLPEPPKGE